ncbi:MAG TPA: AMP-binding protein [Alphaproteobacteria bacterium]|jgi:crotonobetaine/carnitine-CoA ligase|nr:AMP-binding protein [Alphaproteobacteria bacterium]
MGDGLNGWSTALGWALPDRLPTAAECTARPLLERWAREAPGKTFVLFEDGTQWTFAETLQQVRRTAAMLFGEGVRAGDLVLNWLGNGPDHLRIWLAANYIGAVNVPIATTARSGELQHILANSGARVLAAERALAGQIAGPQMKALETVILFGEGETVPVPCRTIDGSQAAGRWDDAPVVDIEPFDIAFIIYTSGTTGLPKGVRSPYAQFWTLAKAQIGYLGADDRVMISTSLSHISTASSVWATLYVGASVAMFQRFSVNQFWDRVRAVGATALPGLGPAIISMLLKAPASERDQDNPLKIVNVRAPNAVVREFAERFGVDYFSAFSMTETSCVTISARNSTVEGSCGRARPGVRVRLVDANDVDVPQGTIGEIVLRADLPGTLNAGYHRDPEATARAWRNGWFHTGDLASLDSDGNVFFHDRLKDCIRRRGENISSSEVEREALAFPAVQQAAAVGVAGAFDDQEVLLIVEPGPGQTVDPAELAGFIATRLSDFKVPRYVCVRNDLPLTTFGKVQKYRLLAEIDLAACWDRERDA